MGDKCYLCGKPIRSTHRFVDTRDDQIVAVGPDCYARIAGAGDEGVQCNDYGLRLYLVKKQ